MSSETVIYVFDVVLEILGIMYSAYLIYVRMNIKMLLKRSKTNIARRNVYKMLSKDYLLAGVLLVTLILTSNLILDISKLARSGSAPVAFMIFAPVVLVSASAAVFYVVSTNFKQD